MKRLGLALGGGGARGLAHIGVFKVLEQAHIPIACLAGTSMGGILAAAYALGYTSAELEQRAIALARPREWVKLVELAAPRRGLLDGRRVRDYLAALIDPDCDFADLRLPTALCAVDLERGEEVYLTEGSLLSAALATSAMPGVLPPQIVGPRYLVDGGVLNNVPANLARSLGADVVLAVDPQIDPHREPRWQELQEKPRWPFMPPDLFLDFYRAELLMVAELTRAHLRADGTELLIYPRISVDITMFLGFVHAQEIIDAGEEAARQALPRIQALLELA